MNKESMGIFLENAVASVLKYYYEWQTVIENYYLPKLEGFKKHEAKTTGVEIDVFGFNCFSEKTEKANREEEKKETDRILAPKEKKEIIIIQCKDEWYQDKHEHTIETLNKAEEVIKKRYPGVPIRKGIVTVVISPSLLKDIEKYNVFLIFNLASLTLRENNQYVQELIEKCIIGDLREEIITPLLNYINRYLDPQQRVPNFSSLSLQVLRFFINLTYYSDSEKYYPFMSKQICDMYKNLLQRKREKSQKLQNENSK